MTVAECRSTTSITHEEYRTVLKWIEDCHGFGTKPPKYMQCITHIYGHYGNRLVWIFIISPVSEGSGDVMVLRRSRPPPAAHNGVNAITPKPRELIVLKFGIHIGSDSVLTWLTFQGRRSKVKVTASENDVIFSTFLNFHFSSHFPPKPSWGGHSNTPQQ